VTTHIDDIINTTANPIETFMITTSSITGELPIRIFHESGKYVVSRIGLQIDVHETVVRSPDCSSHRWPGLLDAQHAFNVISVQFFSRCRIDDSGFNTEERERCTAWFGRGTEGERRNNVATGLSLPVGLR